MILALTHVARPADTMTRVELVIFDLDGTLLNTEQLVAEVARSVVQRHGKTMTL